jgi:hypothetical protein
MESISDNVMGPYVSQGNCYTKNLEGNDMGHNLTALIAPTGTSPYTLSVGEIVPGQMFSASSPNGPWTSLGLTQTTTNGHSGCGSTSSNFTFTVGHDNRFWATSRAGCVMDSDQVLGPYKIETDSVLPNLENNDNHDAEDECIWYSGGYYHIVFNYWPVQRAYHIMSKDGITNWTSTGMAYQAAQTPANANSNWLRYTDGTVNVWHNMERVGVIVENGHPTHFTFAVTDANKNVTGVSQGGSKILVVPFNGVQFDCDNGDQASCDEAGAGAAGSDGGGAGGSIPVDGGTGGAVTADAGRGAGGATGAGGSSGTGGVTGAGGSSGRAVGSGGATNSGGASGSGGATTAGGATSTGGASRTAGTIGAGGAPSTGGAVSAGGSAGVGGAAATSGAAITGGATVTGGLPSTGGASVSSSTNMGGSMSPAETAGATTSSGSLANATGSGCSCKLSGNGSNPTSQENCGFFLLGLAWAGLHWRRRTKRRQVP